MTTVPSALAWHCNQWPGRAVGASQSDSVGGTQLRLGGALARNVLSKSTPEETIKQIQVEHFVEQLALDSSKDSVSRRPERAGTR